jgi:hypothetical protein
LDLRKEHAKGSFSAAALKARDLLKKCLDSREIIAWIEN